MCMGGCGGSKKASPKKSSTPKFGSPPKSYSRRTNWNTGGFGTPKIKFSFGKGR